MEWLHFSDFHFGRKAGPQYEAIASLLDFASKSLADNPGPIDAVFLVGDIAYSGSKDEYTRFENDFLVPLLQIPGVRGAKVFSVPGNHDVDCEASTPITWGGIKERNQQIYFSENGEGQAVRRHRADVFRHYTDFATRNALIGPNPYEEVSLLYRNPEFLIFPRKSGLGFC